MANLPDSFSDIQSGDIHKHQLVDKINAKTIPFYAPAVPLMPESV
jgi:hypothetical protein